MAVITPASKTKGSRMRQGGQRAPRGNANQDFLFRHNPLPMWIYDAATMRFLEVNEAAAETYGYSRLEFLNMTVRQIRHATNGRHPGASSNGKARERHLCKDGRVIEVDVASRPVEYQGTQAVFVSCMEPTGGGATDESLAAAERRFRALVEHAPDAIGVVAPDGTLLYDSPAAPRLLGYGVDELLGRSAFELIHPDDVAMVQSLFGRVLQDASSPVKGLFRFQHKNGSWRWLEAAATNLLEEPSVRGIVINYRDVTEREEAQAAVRESEEKFRNLFDHADIGVFRAKLDGSKILDANPKFLEIFGRTHAEVLGASSTAHWANPEEREILVSRLQADGRVTSTECDMLNKQGHIRRCVISMHLDRKRAVLEEYIVDITERRQAEQALQASEQKFRNLFDNADIGLFRTRLDASEVLDVNDKFLHIFGYRRDEIVGAPSAIHWAEPAERERMIRALREQGHVSGLECDMLTKGGEIRRCLTSLYLYPAQGILEGTILDITDRKRAEQALRESEQRYRGLVEHSPDAIAVHQAGRIVYVNPAALKVMGAHAVSELVGRPILDIVHPDYRAMVTQRVEQTETGAAAGMVEEKFVKLDGTPFDVEVVAIPLTYEGRPATQVVVHDVTERKRMEEALRESELKFRLLTEQSFTGVYIIQDGRMAYVNPSFARTFGYSPDEISGKLTPADLIHPDDIQAVMRRMQERLQGKAEVAPITYRAVRKDRSIINIEVYGTQSEYLGKPAVLGTLMDVTERERAQAENEALLKIMRGAATAADLAGFLELTRQALGGVLDANNLFVVFHDDETGLFEEVFSVDKYDPPMPPSRLEKSITSHVFRTGKPLRLSGSQLDQLFAGGEVELVGRRTASWLGAPLGTDAGVIGVIAVQNYEKMDCYTERDEEFLASVGAHVALAIARKRAMDETAASEAELRALFAAMSDVVVVLDSDGTYVKVAPTDPSGSLYRPAEELLGKRMHQTLPRELADHVLEKVRQSLRTGDLVHLEYGLPIRGVDAYFSAKISPLSENTVLFVAHDITDRKAAEESIRARTEEVAKLYELARELASASSLDEALNLAARHAVENVHVTVARFGIQEDGQLAIRAAYPVRVIGHDLGVGNRRALSELPHVRRALREHEVVMLHADEAEIDEVERRALLLDFTSQACVVPLWVGETAGPAAQTLGALILSEARSTEREPLSPEKVRAAESIGAQTATTIRRLLLTEQTESRLRHVVALREIDEAISASFDLRTVLNVVLGEAVAQLSVDAAAVAVLDPSTPVLTYISSKGFRSGGLSPAQISVRDTYTGRVALEREPLFIKHLPSDPDYSSMGNEWRDEGFVSYYGIPLIVKGRVRGALEAFQRSTIAPTSEWFDFMGSLGRQAAIAIENSELFENLQRTNAELTVAYGATIEGWSRALDLRDKETEGHTQRVTEMTLRLARHFNFTADELMQIRWGGLLHDIGKMAVPDTILLKPGPLTDEEWAVMKKHPVFAREMLVPIRYLRGALDIPYCHHERWDGSGYPRGLEGTAIPLPARIFAVVDVWDALTSDRPYRKAWLREEALQHIREQSGKHFDPQVVEPFLRLMDNDPGHPQTA